MEQALVSILIALISSITTVVVALIGQRVSKKVRTRNPKSVAGYERLFNYLDERLKNVEQENTELRALTDRLRDSFQRERSKREKVEELSERRRERLLEFSRKYSEDVSALV